MGLTIILKHIVEGNNYPVPGSTTDMPRPLGAFFAESLFPPEAGTTRFLVWKRRHIIRKVNKSLHVLIIVVIHVVTIINALKLNFNKNETSDFS